MIPAFLLGKDDRVIGYQATARSKGPEHPLGLSPFIFSVRIATPEGFSTIRSAPAHTCPGFAARPVWSTRFHLRLWWLVVDQDYATGT